MQTHLTERLTVAQISRAAQILKTGGTVALPTETVYGLGANALDAEAVAKIFLAKERPGWDPLIVHIAQREMLPQIAADVPETAQLLMEHFWPGPLTLLLPRTPAIPNAVTAGRPLVGVRMPAHPIAREVIRRAGVPIAAPSANRFGHVSPTTAQHVLDDLNGRIDAVLDAGPCDVGVESTVFDPVSKTLYRPGAVTKEQIEALIGPIHLFQPPSNQARPESLPSPGVGIRHYAPHAKVILVKSEGELAEAALRHSNERVGALLPPEWSALEGVEALQWAPLHDTPMLAQTLFARLREMDARSVDWILIPLPSDAHDSLAAALIDRLQKAAM